MSVYAIITLTNMAKHKSNTKDNSEPDGVFLLKIVLYFILGCLWIQVGDENIAIPIGLILGLIFSSHEHFSIDKKIEYTVLFIACILSFVLPIGFVLAL